ncbi:hypothetical protein LINPERHAP1_LOCUS9613 [Linum perenne]
MNLETCSIIRGEMCGVIQGVRVGQGVQKDHSEARFVGSYISLNR